jgi:phytoene synthase
MSSRLELDSALARCAEIVHRRPTHLGSAAAGLNDARRRALFLASYASMRIADDLVDEQFLTGPKEERVSQRPRVQAALRRWLLQSEWAAEGRFEADADSLEPELFTALSELLGPTQLNAEPWQKLAASLARDLDERPVQDWEDFLGYCEGACIAPASVFVYIVSARFDGFGGSRFPVAAAPREYARDLAIYSYLVHMRRDLLADARRSSQLVLLPRDWMIADGLDESEAMAALREGELGPLGTTLARLAEETEIYRARALRSLDRAESELGVEAALRLRSILRLYEATARSTSQSN